MVALTIEDYISCSLFCWVILIMAFGRKVLLYPS